MDSTVKIWTCCQRVQTRYWLLLEQLATWVVLGVSACFVGTGRQAQPARQCLPTLRWASFLLLGPALSAAKTMPSPSLSRCHVGCSPCPTFVPTLDGLRAFLLFLDWYRFDQFLIEIKASWNMKKSTKLNLNKRYRVGFNEVKTSINVDQTTN